MQIGITRCHAAAWRAQYIPLLDQIGLQDILDRTAFLGNCSGETFHTDRPAIEFFQQRQQ